MATKNIKGQSKKNRVAKKPGPKPPKAPPPVVTYDFMRRSFQVPARINDLHLEFQDAGVRAHPEGKPVRAKTTGNNIDLEFPAYASPWELVVEFERDGEIRTPLRWHWTIDGVAQSGGEGWPPAHS